MAVAGVVMLCAGLAHAAPTAKIMRIDPRASMDSGVPLISMVVDLSEWRSTSDALAGCGTPNNSNDYLDCAADSLERGEATYKPLKWPGEPASGEPDIGAEKQNAQLLVTVDGVDMPAEYTARTRWGKSKDQPAVGTAYLILIDASGSMGGRLDHAKMVAKAFIDKKDRNDIFNVKAFNDIAVLPGSGWLNDANALRGAIDSVAKTSATQGRARPLFNLIKQATIDGFSELGNVGQRVETPMHQALVVLSDGWAGTDASSAPPLAIELGNYLAKGILDENNLTLPRMPIPVISVWFPVTAMEEFFENSREFMKNLPVPAVGGGFYLVRDGKENRAGNIVAAVKRRFDQMHIVKWKVACLQPNLNQTLKLAFIRTSVNIAGDSFVNAPLGVDPTLWPLDVNVEETTKAASKDPIYPGGKVQIYGNFCWGNDAQRAELYLIPKNQDLPETIKNMTVDDAKSLRDSLTKGGFRGTAIKSGENFVEFQLPDNEKFLTGKEDNYTARIIVLDGKSKRFSAVTQSAVISVKAKKPPMSLVTMLLIGGGAFGGTVILLLLVTVFRSGGKRRGGGGGPPPRPVVAAGGPAPAPFPQPAPVMPGPMPMAPAPSPMGPPGGAPSPFGAPPAAAAPHMVQQATLSGPPGMFPITPGREVRAGRDPGTCEIVLSEPRVSGTHATMKIDGGQLFVRDEGSNNGTFVNGGRIQAHVWTPVGQGASVKFGPIEFSVRLE